MCTPDEVCASALMVDEYKVAPPASRPTVVSSKWPAFEWRTQSLFLFWRFGVLAANPKKPYSVALRFDLVSERAPR